MSITIDIRELPARLSEALAIVSSGREVLLTDGVVVCARMVPYSEPVPRIPGLHANAMQAAADFDALLPDEMVDGDSDSPDMLGQNLEWFAHRSPEDIQAARERILGASPPAREIPAGKSLLDMVEGKWPGTETDPEIQNALARRS